METVNIRIYKKDLPRLNVEKAKKGFTQPQLIEYVLDRNEKESLTPTQDERSN